MEDLRQRPDENRSQYGWRLLMHDLRNPEQPMQPIQPQQPEVTETAGITNIINNYPASPGVPTTLKRFNFASIYATVVMVVMLTIAGVLLWKMGVITYLINMFQGVVP